VRSRFTNAFRKRGRLLLRGWLLCAGLAFCAAPAWAAGDKPPQKDPKPGTTKTSCTADEKRFCDEVTKNFEGKPCGKVAYKVVGSICQCECLDQPGGTAPKKGLGR
jgi:hypothetical protein